MWRLRWLISPCLLASILFSLSAFGQSADSSIGEIQKLLDQKNFAQAEAASATLLLANADNSEALSLHATALARQGKNKLALVEIERLIARFPADSTFTLRKAQYNSWSGRLATAQQTYAAIVDKFPGDWDALTGLGLVQFWTGDFTEAQKSFRKVLKNDSKNELAFVSLIKAMNAAGNFSEAFDLALTRDKTAGEKDPELGLLLASMGANTSEKSDLEKWIGRPTDDEDLLRRQTKWRAQQLISLGHLDDATQMLQKFVSTHPSNLDALVDAGDILVLADQRPLARAAYDKVVALLPEKIEPRLGLARIASREGLLGSSFSIYEKIVQQNPEAIEGWLGMARVASLMQDFTGAEKALEAARKTAPHSRVIQEEKLKLLLQAGKLTAFETEIRQWHASDPDASFLWRQRWLSAKKQVVDSDAILKRIDSASPENIARLLHILIAGRPDNSGIQLPNFHPNPKPFQTQAFQNRERYLVARQLALSLHPREAIQLVASNSTNTERISALANGWWAYVSTPFAFRSELKQQLDLQALAIWLAGQWQKRLHTLFVETDSPLEEDWYLQRAIWLDRWKGEWNGSQASDDLLKIIMVQMGSREISFPGIAEAWSLSEQTNSEESDFSSRIAMARWRQYRFQYTGAISLLASLSRDFPASLEPLQRQAAALRASGRWNESASIYKNMLDTGKVTPQIRLEYAELLRMLRYPVQAASQYRMLQEQGFNEPDVFRGKAELYISEGLVEKALETVESGLQIHPGSFSLLEFKADLLRKNRRIPDLSALIAHHPEASWISPDSLAPALPFLSAEQSQAITTSPSWIFGWQWLPFYRLPERSLRAVTDAAEAALSDHDSATSIQFYQRILDAKIPDSDAWFAAGRLFDFNKLPQHAERTFKTSFALGAGRIDAETAELIEQSRRQNPAVAARTFSQRLEERPDERTFRVGLVTSLIRAGEPAAAEKALQPLIESAPDDPEVRLLAAQVKASEGRVRQARSLDQSILRADPLSYDARAGRLSLNDADEFGFTVGYNRSFLKDTSPASAPLPDWEETFAAGYWHRPNQQTFSMDYHHFSRFGLDADQLNLGYAKKINDRWILRLSEGTALSGQFIPDWRVGAGASRRLTTQLFADLDFNHLHFSDVSVWQAIPGITWRWHPRLTTSSKVYLSQSDFKGGLSNHVITYSFGTSWEFSNQSAVQIHYSIGGEDASNVTRNLIGENGFQSVGLNLKLGWRHRFSLEPNFNYETHQQFDSYSFGLAFGYAY